MLLAVRAGNPLWSCFGSTTAGNLLQRKISSVFRFEDCYGDFSKG